MQISAIAILVNPTAGRGKSSRLSIWLEKQLTNKQIPCTIFNAKWPQTFEGFSDIWIIGGDGTVNYFINHYPNCHLPLAIFKGGTGNDFAWKLYGDISTAEQLELVLNAKPQPIDAGKINGTLFINCLGVGFDGEIVRSMNAIRLLGGHIGYLLAVIKKILTFREKHFTITANNETWNDRFLLLMISNSSRAGGGFFIAPTAHINDGKLDMLLCKKLSVIKRLKYLPIIKKGKHMQLPFVVHRLGEKFSITSATKVDVQVDGELLTTRELQVEVLPERFMIRF